MQRITLFGILFALSLNAWAGGKSKKTVPLPPQNPYLTIDNKALAIPDSLTRTSTGIASYVDSNFTTDTQKVRAIYIWIATNIAYDFDNMFAINFYEEQEEKIAKPLKTRKGICANYAALFVDICNKAGIKAYVIEGYTKQNGFADYIPHAWCAALIDSTWLMYDPTWGSGYVKDGRFHRQVNNDNFSVQPAKFIVNHMPFDFLWEFLYHPASNQAFYDGKTWDTSESEYFNFPDSIRLYYRQTRMEQLLSSAERINRNGVKNAMIFDRLHHIKAEIENLKAQLEYERQADIAATFNKASAAYNDAISGYNSFIDYRNKQFIPPKPDDQIRQMLDTVSTCISLAQYGLKKIVDPGPNANLVAQLDKAIHDLIPKLDEQRVWLEGYLKKSRIARKSAFITWLSIPAR